MHYARQKAEADGLTCAYLNQSMFDMQFDAEFDLILLINSLARQLTLSELEALLVRAKKALKPNGHLIGEFSVAPPELKNDGVVVSESTFLMQHSPWSATFHAWLCRDLIFSSTNERVNHHLIVEPNGRSKEYWSLFSLYPQSLLTELLTKQGLQVQNVFGEKLGQSYQPTQDDYCFTWARNK